MLFYYSNTEWRWHVMSIFRIDEILVTEWGMPSCLKKHFHFLWSKKMILACIYSMSLSPEERLSVWTAVNISTQGNHDDIQREGLLRIPLCVLSWVEHTESIHHGMNLGALALILHFQQGCPRMTIRYKCISKFHTIREVTRNRVNYTAIRQAHFRWGFLRSSEPGPYSNSMCVSSHLPPIFVFCFGFEGLVYLLSFDYQTFIFSLSFLLHLYNLRLLGTH